MAKGISEHAAKGGRARKNVLTAEERSQIARNAVRARWAKAGKLKDTQGDNGAPEETARDEKELGPTEVVSMLRGIVQMGPLELECHVLNDGRRVFTQREVVRAISGGRESGNLPRYLERNPLVPSDFRTGKTISFKVPGTQQEAIGYEATLLIELCDLYLQARDEGVLKRTQLKLAAQAEIIMRSCAKVGIIALIDEATGFQKIRERRALQLKFQAFIADDLQQWARMFKEEFWLELARLEGVRYSPRSRPLRWGRYIMMFVYDAIDADVGRELRKKNPSPRFLKNHHQWLKKFGRDKVHDQIERVVTIMKLCDNMDEFRTKFNRVFKKSPSQRTFDDWMT